MRNNTPLLVLSLLTVFASPAVYAADSHTDTQQVSVTIPEVSLIEVTGEISASLKPPVEAGENFEHTSIEQKATYDISANIAAYSEETKKIVVTSGKVPAGWKFDIEMEAPNGAKSLGVVSLTQKTTSGDAVSNIQNVAQKGLGMRVSVGPEDKTVMPSHTKGEKLSVGIVYTITAGK